MCCNENVAILRPSQRIRTCLPLVIDARSMNISSFSTLSLSDQPAGECVSFHLRQRVIPETNHCSTSGCLHPRSLEELLMQAP